MPDREDQKRTVGAYLFNPFRFIAGMESLLLGLFAIGLAGFLGAYSNTHFDGVLDAHTGAAAPMWCFLTEGFVSWICMAVVLAVFGKITSKTSFRMIDLFGTQALARWPTVIVAAACLLPGYTRFINYITWHFANQGDQVDFTAADAAVFSCVILLILAVICWIVFLMYRSYSVSCNVSGGKAVGTFVAAIIMGEILSKVAIVPMLLFVQQDQSWKPRKNPIPERLTYQYEQAYDFEDSSGIEIVNEDEGLSASVTNEEVRIVGETTDRTWKSDGVHVRFDDKLGDMEFSGSFRVEEKSASGLVFLELAIDEEGPVIIMFQWAPLFEGYQIQDAHLNMNTTIESEIKTVGALGTEATEFNTMTIVLPESRMHADFFVNDTYIDRLLFSEKLGEVQSMRLAFQTSRKGKKYDVRLDDLTMRWNDSPIEQEKASRLKETGGLLLHYTFDDVGSQVADASGQDCAGELKGEPVWTNGVIGGGLLLEDKRDYVVLPKPKRLREVQIDDYTLAAWFKPSSVPAPEENGYAVIIRPGCHLGLWYCDEQKFWYGHWFRDVDKDLEWSVERSDNPDGIVTAEMKTPDLCPPNRWYHVCGVASKTDGTLSLYLNGKLVASRKWPTSSWYTLNYHDSWRIGRAYPGEDAHSMGARGAVDEVRIYNRALSAEEIEAIYRDAFPDGEAPVAAVPSEIEKLEADATAGDMHAQMALSWKYEKGDGVPKDLSRARKLRELAADQGHPNAETARANEYKAKGDFERALIWYRRAGEHGDSMGFYYAGDLYFHGKGTTQDYAQARKLFERGFEMKNRYCASSLTAIYNEGKGVPEDSNLAAKYWRSAAEYGLGVAQLNMGDQCEQGGDIEGAREWYRKAAAQGDSTAKERLKRMGSDAE